jgi:hypothetical protein
MGNVQNEIVVFIQMTACSEMCVDTRLFSWAITVNITNIIIGKLEKAAQPLHAPSGAPSPWSLTAVYSAFYNETRTFRNA